MDLTATRIAEHPTVSADAAMRNAVKASRDTATRRSTKRHTILLLATNPYGTDRLALDREALGPHGVEAQRLPRSVLL